MQKDLDQTNPEFKPSSEKADIKTESNAQDDVAVEVDGQPTVQQEAKDADDLADALKSTSAMSMKADQVDEAVLQIDTNDMFDKDELTVADKPTTAKSITNKTTIKTTRTTTPAATARVNLWVLDLNPKTTTANDLRILFSKYAKVCAVRIVTDKKSFYGRVIVETGEQAKRCIKMFNNTIIGGTRVRLQLRAPDVAKSSVSSTSTNAGVAAVPVTPTVRKSPVSAPRDRSASRRSGSRTRTSRTRTRSSTRYHRSTSSASDKSSSAAAARRRNDQELRRLVRDLHDEVRRLDRRREEQRRDDQRREHDRECVRALQRKLEAERLEFAHKMQLELRKLEMEVQLLGRDKRELASSKSSAQPVRVRNSTGKMMEPISSGGTTGDRRRKTIVTLDDAHRSRAPNKERRRDWSPLVLHKSNINSGSSNVLRNQHRSRRISTSSDRHVRNELPPLKRARKSLSGESDDQQQRRRRGDSSGGGGKYFDTFDIKPMKKLQREERLEAPSPPRLSSGTASSVRVPLKNSSNYLPNASVSKSKEPSGAASGSGAYYSKDSRPMVITSGRSGGGSVDNRLDTWTHSTNQHHSQGAAGRYNVELTTHSTYQGSGGSRHRNAVEVIGGYQNRGRVYGSPKAGFYTRGYQERRY